VRPRDIYKETAAQQKRALLISQYIDEKNKKDATEDTAMDLKDTLTDSATIREVALAETRKENKTLKNQVERLTQQMRSLQKNSPAGAPPAKGSPQTKMDQNRRQSAEKPPLSPNALPPATNPPMERTNPGSPETRDKQELAYIVDEKIISLFGFLSDPKNTRRHNLCLRLHPTPTPTPLFAASPKHSAYHNLCTMIQPPPRLGARLELGLKFCLQPRHSTPMKTLDETITRFQRDIYIHMYFAGSTDAWDPTQIYFPSQGWNPPANDIPIEFRARVSDFLR
jgi:hypothetical protein